MKDTKITEAKIKKGNDFFVWNHAQQTVSLGKGLFELTVLPQNVSD